MAEKTITNPSGAFGQSDEESNMPQTVEYFQVSGSVDVADGDAVSALWDETNSTLKVEPWDTDASGQSAYSGFGVALDAGTAGDWIRVVTYGFAMVNIGSGNSATAYQSVLGSTTKGVVTSTSNAATVVVGSSIGKFLGNEDGTSDKAPMWVCLAG